MRRLIIAASTAALAGCFHRAPRLPESIPALDRKATTLFNLSYADRVEGTGAVVAPKKCLFAHYTGWLTDGKKFDSSRDTMPNGSKREPISFSQGARAVIAGWDLGFEGMKVGGQRRLFIPYQLAYGEAGRPPVIPPKSELIFDVELMAVSDTIVRKPDSTATSRGRSGAPQCPTWKAVSGS